MKIDYRHLLFLGFALRIAVAIWNGFFGPSIGADFDAITFHLHAVEYAHNPTLGAFRIGPQVYETFLGLFYYLTIGSLFLGSLLSCIVWLLSALILTSCMRVLLVERSAQTIVMLIYALLPSSIMFTAVTLREPYQLFFVNLAIYAILKIYLHKADGHWLTLIAAITGASLFHQGSLLAYGLLLFAGALLLVAMRGKNVISWAKLGMMCVISAAVLWYGFSFYGNISYDLSKGLVGTIEGFQQGLMQNVGRATYRSEVIVHKPGDLLVFIPIALLQYLFEPFPWHVSATSDIVLVAENILRGWLIWKAWKAFWSAPKLQRRTLLFIILSYFSLEMIWAIGTINWGTAVRHHVPAFGLLLLAAYGATSSKTWNKKTTQHSQIEFDSAKV
jgi:hypothetical protein